MAAAESTKAELLAAALEVYEAQARLRVAQKRLCAVMRSLLREPVQGAEVRYVQAPDLSVWRLLWNNSYPFVERVEVVQVRGALARLPGANVVGAADEPLDPLEF